jgi:hypothetical protein
LTGQRGGDGSAGGLGINFAADLSEFDAATGGFGLYLAVGFLDMD